MEGGGGNIMLLEHRRDIRQRVYQQIVIALGALVEELWRLDGCGVRDRVCIFVFPVTLVKGEGGAALGAGGRFNCCDLQTEKNKNNNS